MKRLIIQKGPDECENDQVQSATGGLQYIPYPQTSVQFRNRFGRIAITNACIIGHVNTVTYLYLIFHE